MKAKINFLWYRKGDEIKEKDLKYIDDWVAKGFVEKEKKKEKPVAKPKDKKKKSKK